MAKQNKVFLKAKISPKTFPIRGIPWFDFAAFRIQQKIIDISIKKEAIKLSKKNKSK